MPTETAADPKIQATRMFSRRLVLVGLALAGLFLLALRFGEAVLGPVPTPLPFQLDRITPAIPPDAPTCDVLSAPSDPFDGMRFHTTPTSTPDIFEITLGNVAMPAVLMLDNNPDRIRLLACAGSDQIGAVLQSGTMVPQSGKPLTSTLTALPIKTTDPAIRHLVWVENVAALPFKLSVLSEADFRDYSDTKLKIHIGLISAIALMITYNLALALSSRTPAFLFNALSISCILLLDVYRSGVGMTYLWPELPQLNPFALIAALAGVSMFAPFYLYRFIVPLQKSLLQEKPAILIWPILTTLAVSSLLFLHPIWVTLAVLVLFNTLSAVVTVQLVHAAYRGHEPAAVFLVTAIGVVVPALIAGAARELAGADFGAFGAHLMEVGLLLEAPAFTLVLAYQILLTRKGEVDAVRALNRHAEASKRSLLDALDNERTRLASDLHDSGGQMLGLVLSRLRGVAQSTQGADSIKSEIEDIAGLTRETLDELRRVTHDLHPATLTHLGLKRAISAMGKEITKAGRLRVHSKLDFDEDALSPTQSLQVYRIFQELVANASRHSGATDATLELSSGRSRFLLRFSDNGSISTDQATGTGLGKEILVHRVARLGGTQHTSTGEFGTTTTITFDASQPHQGRENEEHFDR